MKHPELPLRVFRFGLFTRRFHSPLSAYFPPSHLQM